MSRRRRVKVDWSRVRQIRIASKSGSRTPSQEELRMCEAAMAEDPERYSAMSEEVFNVTAAAIGSVRRWPKKGDNER